MEPGAGSFSGRISRRPLRRSGGYRHQRVTDPLGSYREAVAFLEPRFANAVPPLWAALDLSLAYQKLGSYPQAITVLIRAERHYPREKQIHFRLMRLYTLTGKMDRAQQENALFAGTAHP